MSSRIIYVLCYDDASEQKAITDFKDYNWARIYRIPIERQTHLFECVMYQTELMNLYDEWKDKEFVGTISYKLKDRLLFYPYRTIDTIDFIISNTDSNQYTVVPFMYYSGLNFEKLNQNIKEIYTHLCNCFFSNKNKKTYSILTSIRNHSSPIIQPRYFFFNYWMTTPAEMVSYIDFFNTKWLPVLESQEHVWNNSDYKGALTPNQLRTLTKRVSHYPYHPFLNERLPADYFRYRQSKILY